MTIEKIKLKPDPFGLNRWDFNMRVPEKSEKFDETDAHKYIKGCDFPETADDLLLAWEMQRRFGPVAIRRMRILDTMCGPGRLGREFLELGAHHVVFHDGHETMIGHAKTEAFNMMQSGQSIGFVLSDVGQISLPDNAFDLVICHNSIHQLSDFGRLNAVMSEFVRVTDKNGSIVIADFQRPRTIELLQAASDRLAVTNPKVRKLLKESYRASFSKKEFAEAISPIPGIKKWSVTDAEPPVLTEEMKRRVDQDPFLGHLMDYGPISLRAIIQKE